MSDQAVVAPLFVSVPVAASLLGIAERTAYSLIERSEFPVPVETVGTRLKVSRILIERLAAGES